ncbi:MAG: hypothetical protein ACE5GA_08515 [Candidatus Zixiibacteriota bacterium]
MNRSAVMGTILLAMFAICASVWSLILADKSPDLPLTPQRPDGVPQTAVWRNTGQMWFDFAPANDGVEGHVKCVFYYRESLDTTLQVASSVFVLDGAPLSMDELRERVRFYDGVEIHLRGERIMYPYHN